MCIRDRPPSPPARHASNSRINDKKQPVSGKTPAAGFVVPCAKVWYLSLIHIWQYYEGELDFVPYSTDANIPLSRNVLANTIGTVKGAGALSLIHI